MSLSIIPGRNNGYPCVPELEDMNEVGFTSLLPQCIMILDSERCEGYPSIKLLPPLPESTRFITPYPQYMMRITDEVNEGYPYVPTISNAAMETYSCLYFGDKLVTEMYYGDTEIKLARCCGTMFRKYD